MSYATYITDALVCGVRNSQTSDRTYLLFTREAGMLFATARSVREERSKQRYALQTFSQIRVTLIKGKSGWRIGSVEAKNNYYHQAEDQLARGSVVRIFRQLRRFISGEEVATALFDLAVAALTYSVTTVPARAYVDKCIELRILYALGYVTPKYVPDDFFAAGVSTLADYRARLPEAQLDRLLKTAVTASQL